MRILNQGNLAIEVLDQLAREISAQQNLQDAMRWALAQPPGTFLPQIVAEVIVQDEFTHDVIVPRSDGLVLVYDTT
ncbi:MAG TPA: hypothetical protein VKB46_23015 [Pyrinomonadaceae bacterium]|nr:hypothetical protein [Pyrinomonadaceae bacterium]